MSVNTHEPPFHDYLGDSVYVEFDGYSIILKTDHHMFPTSKIALELPVLDALDQYRERIAKATEAKGGT